MSLTGVRVVLVEDQALLRNLLADKIASEDDLRLTECVATATEALAKVTPGSADVALLDIGLPDGDGITLGAQLQRADPDLHVLLLSAHNLLGAVLVAQDDRLLPWSYLSKRSALAAERLAGTVRAVAAGRVVIDPELVRPVAPRPGSLLAALSPTQLQVLQLTAQGLTNVAVGELVGVSAKSVESHLTGVYRTLGLRNTQNSRVAAVLAYLRESTLAARARETHDTAPRTAH